MPVLTGAGEEAAASVADGAGLEQAGVGGQQGRQGGGTLVGSGADSQASRTKELVRNCVLA